MSKETITLIQFQDTKENVSTCTSVLSTSCCVHLRLTSRISFSSIPETLNISFEFNKLKLVLDTKSTSNSNTSIFGLMLTMCQGPFLPFQCAVSCNVVRTINNAWRFFSPCMDCWSFKIVGSCAFPKLCKHFLCNCIYKRIVSPHESTFIVFCHFVDFTQ